MPRAFLIKKLGSPRKLCRSDSMECQDCPAVQCHQPLIDIADYRIGRASEVTVMSSPPCSPPPPAAGGLISPSRPESTSPPPVRSPPAATSNFSIEALLSSGGPGKSIPASPPLAVSPWVGNNTVRYPMYGFNGMPFPPQTHSATSVQSLSPTPSLTSSPPSSPIPSPSTSPLSSPSSPNFDVAWPQRSPSQINVTRMDTDDNANRTSSTPVQRSTFPWDLLTSSDNVTVSRRNEPPRFNCDGCGKSYATFSGLSKHKRFHCTSEIKREFSCKFCDKTYSSLGALKMHIRTHTLPCKCPLCGKAFSRPWLLQGHIRTHTGEKPFQCQHCTRSFADRSNLRAHLQTHTDIKKYNCKTCTKTFSRMSLLLKHEDGGCRGTQ